MSIWVRIAPDALQAQRCPACLTDASLQLDVETSDAREVREGILICSVCGEHFAVHCGVPELLYEPPAYVVAEAAGLERFAEQMRLDGWGRERVRRQDRRAAAAAGLGA